MIPPFRPIAALPRILLLLFLVVPVARAQEPQSNLGPYTRVFETDSLDMGQMGVSPDGRWIVFSRMETPNESSLWIIPANGGAPSRLTSPGYWDGQPSWAPSGDRVLFNSNRPAREESQTYGMMLRVDPATGRAAGQPRQLTLDEVVTPVRASPDGTLIAYAGRDGATYRLKTAPAMGGNARIIHESDRPVIQPTWSGDGKSIYYLHRPEGSDERVVMRIPATGGSPSELFRGSEATLSVRSVSPQGLIAATDAPGQRHQNLILLDPMGREVARAPLGGRMRPAGFAPDGRTLYLVESKTTAPIRVVPVAGGPVREITPGDEYDWPLGWLPDGSAVAVMTRLEGREALRIAPISGGRARILPLESPQGFPMLQAAAGQAVTYTVTAPGSSRRRLVALDFNTREQRILSEDMPHGMAVSVTGRGGEFRDGKRFVYLHREGDRIDVRASSVTGPDHTIRSFPADLFGKTRFGVYENRVAWWQVQGDSTFLMVAEGADGTPHAVHAVPVARSTFVGEIAWSWDGRRIAVHEPTAQSGATMPLLIVDVPRSGARGTARRIETGALYWYFPKWLPDDSGIVTVAGYGAGAESHILLIPLRSGEAPVIVTRDDPSLKWGFELSPDGTLIAYPGEVPGGSAIWKLNVTDVIPESETPN